MAKARSSSRRRGRPKGSKNVVYDCVEAQKTRCSRCKSTDKRYIRKVIRKLPPNHSARPEATHMVLRYYQCQHCPQGRAERSFETI